MPRSTPAFGERIAVALAIGVLTAIFVAVLRPRTANLSSDLDQTLLAARLLWQGKDPYSLIGPGLTYDFGFRWLYPLPAALIVSPIAWLPAALANGTFAGLTGGLLAYGVTRDGWARLPMFLSGAYFWNVWSAQWSALLLAAFFLPVVGAVSIAKPNLAGALSVVSPRHARIALVGGIGLLAFSLVLMPAWPIEWFALARRSTVQRSMLLYPGGVLGLLALLRLRRAEARWLVALLVIPQTPGPYSDLLLFAIPSTLRQTLVLTVLSHLALPIAQALPPLPTVEARIIRYGALTVPLLVLPCVVMILRRPNV